MSVIADPQVSSPGSSSYVADVLGIGGITTVQRQYALSDMIIWNNRRLAMFDWFLRQNMKVGYYPDPEVKYIARREAGIEIPIAVASTSSSGSKNDLFHIADGYAARLKVNDIMFISGIFHNSDASTYTTDKDTAYSNGYVVESVKVTAVGAAGSGSGTGNTKVTVERGSGNNPSTATQVTTNMKLILGSNVLQEGANPATPWEESSSWDYNYLQLESLTLGESDTRKNTDIYGKLSIAERRKLKVRELLRRSESHLVFGHRHISTGNMPTWYTGGFFEYVPGSSDAKDGVSRKIDFGGPFSTERFLQIFEIIAREGSARKFGFCGSGFDIQIQSHFDRRVIVNDQLSKKYGWPVKTLSYNGAEFSWSVYPLLDRFSSTAIDLTNDCIVVDPEFVGLMVLDGMDLTIKENVEQVSTSHKPVDEIFYQIGLKREFPDAHAWIYGIL